MGVAKDRKKPRNSRTAALHAPRSGPLPVPWHMAMKRFVKAARAAYGDRLLRVVLYGSRARGDAEPESDIDVLVVLDCIADFWREHRRVGDIAFEASDGAETIISAMPMSRIDFEERRSPLLLNVRREGIEIG
jgi:predicted nucleotidyltransferase